MFLPTKMIARFGFGEDNSDSFSSPKSSSKMRILRPFLSGQNGVQLFPLKMIARFQGSYSGPFDNVEKVALQKVVEISASTYVGKTIRRRQVKSWRESYGQGLERLFTPPKMCGKMEMSKVWRNSNNYSVKGAISVMTSQRSCSKWDCRPSN